MSDLISRQAAIDALRGYLVGKRCPDDGTLTCRLIENEVINKLPTIHPELGTNLAEVGADLISRQAAIDTLNEYFSRIGKLKRRGLTKGEKAISLDTVGAINSLPPAEPKRGKWILDRSGAYCCSECMEPCAAYVMMKPRDKFCKMCGAKMEVTEWTKL